jgi:hypothetical protein
MPTEPSKQEIDRAAHELASQEQYNPAWLRPGVGGTLGGMSMYRARAEMILIAAQKDRA